MTAPDGRVPDSAYVGQAGQGNSLTGLNDLDEDTAKARMQGNVSPAFNRQRDAVWQPGGLIGNIANLLFGTGPGAPADRIVDGMTALNGRVDLLDDVPGYAGAVMSHNHRFGSGSSWKTIPFNTRYGPEKKAHLDVGAHRMVMETGSWSAHFTISTSGGGGVGHALRALVRDKTGAEVITRRFDWQTPNAGWDQHYAMPIIVPPESAPWSVELAYRHSGLWWTIYGGTEKTLLWVERKNLDSDNSGTIKNPPDGADIE
ncbi:hypothetical protein [Dietzia alimentaria]|uniref:hypothetical protein n=1 Tax=Dietzia alimentaria TaxID=665550 RepID=UPI00029B2AFB|nr:hypothetical protein [Dietzia alimentaria]